MSDKQKNIIKIDRKKLSREEINGKQNWSKILSHHEKITKRPIYQQRKFYVVLLIILIVTYLVYLTEKENNSQEKQTIETPK